MNHRKEDKKMREINKLRFESEKSRSQLDKCDDLNRCSNKSASQSKYEITRDSNCSTMLPGNLNYVFLKLKLSRRVKFSIQSQV